MPAHLRLFARVMQREGVHLHASDQRVFDRLFTVERARQWDAVEKLSKRVEAFVACFGCLRDILADKLIPVQLNALSEHVGVVIDNLDRAKESGWLALAAEWLSKRRLRNQMISECIDDPLVLANALDVAHAGVPKLLVTCKRCWLVDAPLAGQS